MKKIISILLCLTMLLGMAVIVSAAETTAGIVTDVKNLAVGDQIVIGSIKGDYALGAASSNGEYRERVAATCNNYVITVSDSITVITLEAGTKADTYSLKTSDGKYLAAHGSKNHLKSVDAKDTTNHLTSWTISIDNGTATINNVGASKYYLQENPSNSSPRFATYKNTQNDVAIYEVGAAAGTVDTTVTISPIADVLKAAEGKWTVEGVVTHAFYSYGNYTVYVQDATAGIVLYGNNAGFADVEVGDTVIATGSWAPYKNLPELKVSDITASTNTLTASAKSVTITNAKNELCELVTMTGSFTVTEVFDNDGKYSTPNITIADADGNTIVLYSAPLTKNDDETWPIAVGDTVTSVTGVVSISEEEYRIVSRTASEIVYTKASTTTPDPDPTTTPSETPTEEPTTKPTEPEKVGIADGTYVIYNPVYGVALSADYAGTYYNQGVAVTANGNVLTGFGATEIWTVTNNSDGTITISREEGKLSQSTYSSMNFDLENDKWVLESAGNGKYYVKNAGTGKYIEWYAEKSNWSTYYVDDDTADLFAVQFCPVSVDGASATIPATGDSISVFVALMAISAVGIAVIGKKKEF